MEQDEVDGNTGTPIKILSKAPVKQDEDGDNKRDEMAGSLYYITTDAEGTFGDWSEKWFVLSDRSLYMYNSPEEGGPIQTIPLCEATLTETSESDWGDKSTCFQMMYENIQYYFSAQDENIKSEWFEKISKFTSWKEDGTD
ncbi:FERM, ARHGEF and pleckstrin domain-containing protein 1-like [Saccoglossus kowalevskii]